jgi:hypothetical protein
MRDIVRQHKGQQINHSTQLNGGQMFTYQSLNIIKLQYPVLYNMQISSKWICYMIVRKHLEIFSVRSISKR